MLLSTIILLLKNITVLAIVREVIAKNCEDYSLRKNIEIF
jgi:hypothetical protein